MKAIPKVDHWTFWTNRKSCTNCTNTGEKLDYHSLEVKDVSHYCAIQETNQFRNARTSSRRTIILLEPKIKQVLLFRRRQIFADFIFSFYFIRNPHITPIKNQKGISSPKMKTDLSRKVMKFSKLKLWKKYSRQYCRELTSISWELQSQVEKLIFRLYTHHNWNRTCYDKKYTITNDPYPS